jgi:hypothetical protein
MAGTGYARIDALVSEDGVEELPYVARVPPARLELRPSHPSQVLLERLDQPRDRPLGLIPGVEELYVPRGIVRRRGRSRMDCGSMR